MQCIQSQEDDDEREKYKECSCLLFVASAELHHVQCTGPFSLLLLLVLASASECDDIFGVFFCSAVRYGPFCFSIFCSCFSALPCNTGFSQVHLHLGCFEMHEKRRFSPCYAVLSMKQRAYNNIFKFHLFVLFSKFYLFIFSTVPPCLASLAGHNPVGTIPFRRRYFRRSRTLLIPV